MAVVLSAAAVVWAAALTQHGAHAAPVAQSEPPLAHYPTVARDGQTTAAAAASTALNRTAPLALAGAERSGCVIGTAREDCPAEFPRRFENGNRIHQLPHSAYIGVGAIGTLEVPPGEVACCESSGWLFINPPPGSPIPAGCFGTGTMVGDGVQLFQMLRFLDYTNDCAPPSDPSQTCRFPGAPSGDGCRQLSCFQCTRANPADCYCVPQGIMHTASAPAAILGSPC